MSSQTSLVAKNYRLQQWAAQVQDCQNRPEEMLVDDWCRQNNITKATYYYRLKCVRQACLDSLPESATSLSELLQPSKALEAILGSFLSDDAHICFAFSNTTLSRAVQP